MSISPNDEKELLSKVRDLHSVFIGINGQPGHFPLLVQKVDKQEERLRSVERFQYVVTGIGAAISYLTYKLGSLLNNLPHVGMIVNTLAHNLAVIHIR